MLSGSSQRYEDVLKGKGVPEVFQNLPDSHSFKWQSWDLRSLFLTDLGVYVRPVVLRFQGAIN